MVTFKHRSGRTVTAEPGTKRYDIFNRSRSWSVAAGPAIRPAPVATKATGSEPLEEKTVPELREIAESLGLTGYKSLNKADLVQVIAEAQAEKE